MQWKLLCLKTDPTSSALWHISLYRWQALLSCIILFLLPQVKLVDGSGSPIANETVRISLQGGQEMNYTTNEEGRALFALNTSTLYFSSVGIRVSPGGRGGDELTSRTWVWKTTSEVSPISAKVLSFLLLIGCASLAITVVEIAIQQTRLPCDNCT